VHPESPAWCCLSGQRLEQYNLLLDVVDLLQINFSEGFREAVEAKQVAVQEVKWEEFEATVPSGRPMPGSIWREVRPSSSCNRG
jgi:hypothetical protein